MAAHATRLEPAGPLPAEVHAGTPFALRVRASCAAGCALGGRALEVLAPEGRVGSGALVDAGGAAGAELLLTAPPDEGPHGWRVVLVGDALHDAEPLAVAFRTKPHETSMAVWGVGGPVPVGRPHRLRVGVKCAAGCDLAGEPVEVFDDAGRRAGGGRLGGRPWPGSDALYVAEVAPTAPASPGAHEWRTAFRPAGMRIPHLGAEAVFSFRTVPRPDHTVTVRVIDRESGAPLPRAAVFLDAYHASTDGDGLARLALPAGTYALRVRKQGYERPSGTVGVAADVALRVDLGRPPEVHPDELEEWM